MNSNPWFSAVSDYSLQVALFLKSDHKKVLFCADKNHTALYERCLEHKIDFLHIPLHQVRVINFFVSFYKFMILLMKYKSVQNIVVFEGREHTLAGINKLFFPFLWKNKKLIRVRGQAQKMKKRFSQFLLYRYLTNEIIFTARVLAEQMPYALPPHKIKICYYGKTAKFPAENLHYYHFAKQNYDLYFTDEILTFFMLGRFDPVKGHDLLLEAFLKADFKNIKVQLICVGTRQATSAQDLYDKYKSDQNFVNHFKRDVIYHLSTVDEQKKILLIEDHFDDALLFMKHASFGVISSLGSETICRVGVEFLQAGVPVIHSDAGALGEVFSDFPDLKFRSGGVNDFVDKFEFASALFQDKKEFLSIKTKSYDIWNKNYRGDVYRGYF